MIPEPIFSTVELLWSEKYKTWSIPYDGDKYMHVKQEALQYLNPEFMSSYLSAYTRIQISVSMVNHLASAQPQASRVVFVVPENIECMWAGYEDE